MNTKWIRWLCGALFVAVGAGGVFIADAQGWLSPPSRRAPASACRHGLQEGQCAFCDPALIESLGFCVGHGVPEAFCTRCNAALIPAFKVENDWCAGHQLPESQCTLCGPGALDREPGRADAPLETPGLELVRPPHVPRNRRKPSVTCENHNTLVRFQDASIANAAGLEYAPIKQQKVVETIPCNAEISYDRNRYAHLSARAPGVIRAVRVDLGQAVKAGDTLAVIDSPALGVAKAEFLRARSVHALWKQKYATEKELLKGKVSTKQQTLETETNYVTCRIALAKAVQELRDLGLSDAQIETVGDTMDTSSLLPVQAPFDGVVVARHAAQGETTDTDKMLFALADMSRMWGMLDLYESNAARVRVGQPVVLVLDGMPGRPHAGIVTWVGTEVDRRTRTLKVRVQIPNPEGHLRSGMFGKAVITVKDHEAALTVPKGAVQWDGCCNIVFTRQNDLLFQPRKVQLGYEAERFYVIEDGATEGERVVTTGSFLLKTEILKGSIGAGCCEVDPGKT